MVRRLLPNWVTLFVVLYSLQSTTGLAENRRDIKIPCGGATVTEQIALKVSEAGATWTVRVFADQGCQFKKSTATIVEGLTAINWNSPHVAEHVTEVTYQVRVTDQSKEGKMTISGELEPRPGSGGGGGHGGGGGQPKTFSVTVLLRVVELEFTSPANGAPLSVCVGDSANLSVQVRVGDGRPPSTGTVTWQVSTGLPGTTPSPTPLQEGVAETTFTSNGSLTSGAGTIAAQATGLKDADGKPMPDVSATVPGYVTKVIGITPPNPTCELGGEVELTAVLDPPDAPAPPCLTWSVYPPNAGVFTVATGAVVTKFRLTNPCASNATITVNCGGTTVTLTLACSSIAGGWLPIQDYADCANWVQDTLVWPNNGEPLRDACGNTLALWCIGGLIPHYELRYNGVAVAKCVYPCGKNYFWYRLTGDGTRIHSTWHLTRDDPFPNGVYDPDCDKGSRQKVDWRVWRFDCIQNRAEQAICRENQAWNEQWGDPGQIPNGETAGDPSACEN